MTTWSYCGRCGKKLSIKNSREIKTGFCAKCRRPPEKGQNTMRLRVLRKLKAAQDAKVLEENKP